MAELKKGEASAAELVPVQFVVHEGESGEGALIVLRDGSFRMLLRCGAVNFEMKSQNERTAIVGGFADLVDTLAVETPIQIVSHPRQLDTEAYANQYTNTIDDERLPARLRALANAHVQHFEQTVKMQNLLNRELYVVIPFKGKIGPVTETLTDQFPFASLFRVLTSSVEKKLNAKTPTPNEIAIAQQQLDLLADTVEQGLRQIGIENIRRLGEEEVQRLLEECFHPQMSVQHASLPTAGGAPVMQVNPEAEATSLGRRRRLAIEPPKSR